MKLTLFSDLLWERGHRGRDPDRNVAGFIPIYAISAYHH
jgi:hypothetical protein